MEEQNLQSLVLSPCRQGQDFILMGITCGKSQAKTDYGHAIMWKERVVSAMVQARSTERQRDGELDLNIIALRKSEETNKERKGYKYENVKL